MRARVGTLIVAVAAALSGGTQVAVAAFPWHANGTPGDYTDDRLPAGAGQVPADLSGKETWMYAATPEPGNEPVNSQPHELGGVRGAHLLDAADVDTAFRTTLGRPDVLIAVHDSGIEWDNLGAMRNVRLKIRISPGELPTPQITRTAALEDGVSCADYSAGVDDANGDGVFNVADFACDPRVERDGAVRAAAGKPEGDGIDTLLEPQDLLIAFSDGVDDDDNGYKDDIAGWDFLDNDNDAYDDVQYGHGTGEIQDSVAEAANGQDGVGTCPNCMAMPIRVGDSFVADINRFAQGVIYSTDNGAHVVQEALGALNNSRLAREAVDYAYRHGTTIIASAADEAAQHHHWPEAYPGVIVVNSVTKYDDTFSPVPRSYLQFNGCTNFSSKITIAIPSVSCSSDATGRASGMAGLIYSAALNARAAGVIGDADAAACRRVDGSPCQVTANEVRQLMASGTVADKPLADDVNFAVAELSCSPIPVPACTDPQLNAVLGPNGLVVSPLATSRRYPARKGHDQFYGWGRVNMNSAVDALAAGRIPPEVEITAPDWFTSIDPKRTTAAVSAQIDARGTGGYRCRVLVAPGSYPHNGEATDPQPGDFKVVESSWCDGTDRAHDALRRRRRPARTSPRSRRASPPPRATSAAVSPASARRPPAGRPNTEPYGFIVKVEATAVVAGATTKGEDRRNLYLHRDSESLPGWPKRIGGLDDGSGDVESSPLFVDLDGDNRNELVITGSDGVIHAYKRDGSELAGWPARGDRLPLHSTAAHRSRRDQRRRSRRDPRVAGGRRPRPRRQPGGGRCRPRGQDLRLQRAGRPRPEPASPTRTSAAGRSTRSCPSAAASSTAPSTASSAPLFWPTSIATTAASSRSSPRRWTATSTRSTTTARRSSGFPALVVDQTKVAAVDPRSHRITFKSGVGATEQQGAIIDTPAVGDLTGDGKPEIVVGTNEEYAVGEDGGFNSAPAQRGGDRACRRERDPVAGQHARLRARRRW